MRRYFLLAVGLLCTMTISAQQRGGKDMREMFTKAQYEEIVKALGLSGEKVKELEPIYYAFMAEMHPPKDRQDSRLKSESEEEIEQKILSRLAMNKHIAELRERYYSNFRKVLKPSQIMRMYQAEKDIMRRVNSEFGHRRGGSRNEQ